MHSRSSSVSLPLILSLLPFVLAQSSSVSEPASSPVTTLYTTLSSSGSASSTSMSASPSSTSSPMGTGSQNATYLTGLLAALDGLNLGALVNATKQINGTDTGSELLAALSENAENRQLTLFAPTNEAFTGVASNISSSPSLLANVLSYHIVSGNFTNLTQSYPNTTVGRTMLSDMSLVQLGGKDQVLAWSRMSNGNITILNQNTAVSVSQQTQYQNIHINVVDAVIDVPGDLQAALASNNLSSLSTILSSVQASNGQGSLLSVLNDNMQGFSLFAPTDAAISAVQSQLSSSGTDSSSLMTLLGNHIINGTAAYSPNFMEQNYTSAAGEPLDVMANSTGVFVFSGNGSMMAMASMLSIGLLHVDLTRCAIGDEAGRDFA
ncbi:hypothetical protein OE88DRAFT_1665006 [Heliocybe sulcata]|uniref:FAS1 domain-containing protein n=1 Tax=Heliocybe sulcata TaxID=5364 RepID=A0A5C3N2K9_9AGAM|nr:hypothetical protein OE88DRAFT_1665006 [Heliocybe sulcata]